MFKSRKMKKQFRFKESPGGWRGGGNTQKKKQTSHQSKTKKAPKPKPPVRLKANLFSQTHERIVCEPSGAINFVLTSKDSPSFEPLSM